MGVISDQIVCSLDAGAAVIREVALRTSRVALALHAGYVNICSLDAGAAVIREASLRTSRVALRSTWIGYPNGSNFYELIMPLELETSKFKD